MTDSALDMIDDAIHPLASQFGFLRVHHTTSPHSVCAFYANANTGLEIAIDWLELRPFVKLIRLPAGYDRRTFWDLPASTHMMFDADDLLLLRNAQPSPTGKMLPARGSPYAGKLLREYAEALANYARDVLEGDFAVFDELGRIVEERRRRFSGQ